MSSPRSFIDLKVTAIPNSGKTIILAICQKALLAAGFKNVKLVTPPEFEGELSQFAEPELIKKVLGSNWELNSREIRLHEQHRFRHDEEDLKLFFVMAHTPDGIDLTLLVWAADVSEVEQMWRNYFSLDEQHPAPEWISAVPTHPRRGPISWDRIRPEMKADAAA